MWVMRGSLRWSAVLFLSPSSPTGPAATGSDCRGPTRLEAKEGSGSFGGSESPGEALLTPADSAIKDPAATWETLCTPSQSPCYLKAESRRGRGGLNLLSPSAFQEGECFMCSGHVPARPRWAERGLYLCSGLRDPAGANPSTDPVSPKAGIHVEGRVLENP